jgi:hypothetical protein
MQRSKLVLGCVVTLAVVGIGAGAVALETDTGGAGALDETTTTVADPSTTTSTTAVPTTTVAPAVDPAAPVGDESGDAGGVERSTEGCDGGTYANHGDYVSSIAHDPDRAPGDVAAAAHSDCGMPLSAVGDDATDAPEPETPETGAPADPSGPGNGKGNAYGRAK